MAFEGNSHRDSANRKQSEKPAVREPEAKTGGFLLSFLKSDSETIKDYLIETIVIPGITDAIGGIGGIILDSMTEAVSLIFEKQGFTSDDKHKGGYTAYHKVGSRKSSSNHRFRRDDDEVEEEDDDERAYDNVRVKTEREAKDIISVLRDKIDSKGYADVGDLFKEAGEIVTWADRQRGWTSLNSASYVRTRDRKKPWLLVLPKPKSISDLK